MKITALWDMAPCSFVDIDRCFLVHTASIIRAIAMYALLKRRSSIILHCAISQNAVIF
jgi:hypothetical protein